MVNQVSIAGEGRAICRQLQLVVDRFVVPKLEGAASLTLELLGEIQSDSSVREAVQKRSLLLAVMPGCPAAQAVNGIAARLAPGA